MIVVRLKNSDKIRSECFDGADMIENLKLENTTIHYPLNEFYYGVKTLQLVNCNIPLGLSNTINDMNDLKSVHIESCNIGIPWYDVVD